MAAIWFVCLCLSGVLGRVDCPGRYTPMTSVRLASWEVKWKSDTHGLGLPSKGKRAPEVVQKKTCISGIKRPEMTLFPLESRGDLTRGVNNVECVSDKGEQSVSSYPSRVIPRRGRWILLPPHAGTEPRHSRPSQRDRPAGGPPSSSNTSPYCRLTSPPPPAAAHRDCPTRAGPQRLRLPAPSWSTAAETACPELVHSCSDCLSGAGPQLLTSPGSGCFPARRQKDGGYPHPEKNSIR